jgi:hypothetical protein
MAALVLAAAGIASAVAFALSRHSAHAVSSSTTGPPRPVLPSCPRPATAPSPSSTPHDIGGLPFALLDAGVFEQPTPGPHGTIVAIQACGAEESSLRVVAIDPGSGSTVASASFARVAPLASALCATPSGIWFAEGRLALGGATNEPPYLLTLVHLDPSTLRVTGTVDLGRGYGATLAAVADGALIASTGRQLYEVGRAGQLRVVTSFPGVILQHLAVLPGGNQILLSLFTPTAVPPQTSTRLALLDLGTGRQLASRSLSPGAEVESIAASGTTAVVAVGIAGASELRTYSVTHSLARTRRHRHELPATLTPLSVSAFGSVVWAYGQSVFACTGADGSVRSSVTPQGMGEAVSGVLPLGGDRVAVVTPSGIGSVQVHPSCEPRAARATGIG